MSTQNGQAQSVIIKGIGSYAPPKVMTNDDLAAVVDTSDDWIRTRTGIRERRIADGQSCSDLATEAARVAMAEAGIGPGEVDLLIVGTITPDMPFPSTACLVQTKLGLAQIPAFDLGAACSGFLYTLDVAACMLRSGAYRNALVIGSEKLSSILDWQDRTTCVLFGDGAGAVVLGLSDTPGVGLLGSHLAADGAEAKILHMPGGGSSCPATNDSVQGRQHFLKMAGREVFKIAVKAMEQSARVTLERHGIGADDLACIIPHQANIRIIESLSKKMGLSMDRFPVNLDRYGNTSAASIPLALDDAYRAGRIRSGEYTLLIAFGAGLTWASTLIKWH